ncbi:transporter substrate-binding domain-containing protein [Bartonella sp. HY761]|uniref:transporter substrate-binding domain-containing protein n=1 Tax=Bartonella sp. HY761 TaxID=2979330 RepID=UPI00220B65AD|nr:transporter substrate-binding domain-containing protein [Bartonella sp. HY761]UXN06603.1 transporter substrate-binding domain-containing protein [Bartonella sp. HY761]
MKLKTALLAIVAAISFNGSLAQAQEKPITSIRIGTEGAFRPFNFTKPDGSLDGYEIDLGNALCEKMKVECTFVIQPFDSMIPALNAGKFDVIMSGLTNTAKRRETIDFSQSYSLTPQVFATLKGSPLDPLPHQGETLQLASDKENAEKAIEDIKAAVKGRVIGVQTASLGLSLLDAYYKDSSEIREYKTTQQHDLDLKAGRVDMIVASLGYFNDLKTKPGYEDLVLVGPYYKGGLLGQGAGVGMRKNSPQLQAMFNKAIDEAKADGTIKRLSEKWFGFDVTP